MKSMNHYIFIDKIENPELQKIKIIVSKTSTSWSSFLNREYESIENFEESIKESSEMISFGNPELMSNEKINLRIHEYSKSMNGEGKHILIDKNILNDYKALVREVEKNAQIGEIVIPNLNLYLMVLEQKDFENDDKLEKICEVHDKGHKGFYWVKRIN